MDDDGGDMAVKDKRGVFESHTLRPLGRLGEAECVGAAHVAVDAARQADGHGL